MPTHFAERIVHFPINQLVWDILFACENIKSPALIVFKYRRRTAVCRTAAAIVLADDLTAVGNSSTDKLGNFLRLREIELIIIIADKVVKVLVVIGHQKHSCARLHKLLGLAESLAVKTDHCGVAVKLIVFYHHVNIVVRKYTQFHTIPPLKIRFFVSCFLRA